MDDLGQHELIGSHTTKKINKFPDRKDENGVNVSNKKRSSKTWTSAIMLNKTYVNDDSSATIFHKETVGSKNQLQRTSKIKKLYSISSPKMALASLFIIFGIFAPLAECGNPDAKRLYDDLLSNYNKLVRPVVNVTDVLTVRIKLKLSQLIDVVSRTFSCFKK